MAWGHAVAAIVEDTAGQKSLSFHPFGFMVGDLFIQLRLDGIEQSPVQNGGLLAFQDLIFENLCVPRTSFVLISRENRLTSAHHDRAAMFRTGRPGRAIQVEEPA